MKGKLFVIDGVDSSGKESQVKALYARLLEEGYNVRKISFPDYNSDSSALVKMYLGGEFGSNPNDVDSYIASSFYAVDRYASYTTDWKRFYDEGGIIICDRYTTSNMVHQASKLKSDSEKERFLEWLWDLEYNIYKLPQPDKVIFLDMPPKYAMKLMADRKNKITGDEQKDIHESNEQHLKEAYLNAHYVANKFDWFTVRCIKDDQIKSISSISEEVYLSIIQEIKS